MRGQVVIDMQQWWETVRVEFAPATDEPTLVRVTEKCVVALGFKCFAFFRRHSVPGSKRNMSVLSNYPSSWLERYREKGYMSVDPLLKLGTRTAGPIAWSDDLFARVPFFWSEAQAAGLRAGVSQAGWSRGGAYSLLSLAKERGSVTIRDAEALHPYLLLLSHQLTFKTHDLMDNAPPNKGKCMLTCRELDVLRGSTEGKRATELARALGVSESTINFHLQNARKKLGFRTKLQAATYALKVGLLD